MMKRRRNSRNSKEKLKSLFSFLMDNLLPVPVVLFAGMAQASDLTRQEIYERYTTDVIRKAIADNTHRVPYSRDEYPMAQQYQSAIIEYLIQPEFAQYQFSDSDWSKILAAPANNDARFAVPELEEQQQSCQQAMAINKDSVEARAAAMAEIMRENELADRERLEDYYDSFLETLSPAGRHKLEEKAAFPFFMLSISIREADRVAAAQEIPEYIEWEISNDCQSILEQDISSVDETRILADMNPSEDGPVVFRQLIHPELPTNPNYSVDEELTLPVVSTNDPAFAYQSVKLSPADDSIWRLNAAENAERITTVQNAQLRILGHSRPLQAILIVNGYFENDCESLGPVIREFHVDTSTIYIDLYKKTSSPPAGQSVCSPSRSFLYQESLPIYGLAEGVYSVVVNDEHWSTLPVPQHNVLDGMEASRVSKQFPAPSEFDGENLFIPAVDMPEQAGRYQSLGLPARSERSFELVGLRENTMLRGIESVEVIKHGDLPVQAFLRVRGVHDSACSHFGQVSSRFNTETQVFEITMHQESSETSELENFECTSPGESFDIVHPLPVFGLFAGTYNILLNDKHAAELVLEEHNRGQFSNWRPLPIPVPMS